MKDINEKIVDQMKQTRDELKLKTHLMKMDVRDEWDKLEVKFDDMKNSLTQAKEDFSQSNNKVLNELKTGYEKIYSTFK